jgi:hypothetical protein
MGPKRVGRKRKAAGGEETASEPSSPSSHGPASSQGAPADQPEEGEITQTVSASSKKTGSGSSRKNVSSSSTKTVSSSSKQTAKVQLFAKGQRYSGKTMTVLVEGDDPSDPSEVEGDQPSQTSTRSSTIYPRKAPYKKMPEIGKSKGKKKGKSKAPSKKSDRHPQSSDDDDIDDDDDDDYDDEEEEDEDGVSSKKKKKSESKLSKNDR